MHFHQREKCTKTNVCFFKGGDLLLYKKDILFFKVQEYIHIFLQSKGNLSQTKAYVRETKTSVN